jgi:hypothetical protein
MRQLVPPTEYGSSLRVASFQLTLLEWNNNCTPKVTEEMYTCSIKHDKVKKVNPLQLLSIRHAQILSRHSHHVHYLGFIQERLTRITLNVIVLQSN